MVAGLGPWQEVAACMAVGVVFGAGLIAWMAAAQGPQDLTATAEDPRAYSHADVSEMYRRAIGQLRELDEQAHVLHPAYVQQERERQEVLAASMLGRLEALRVATASAAPAKQSRGRQQALPAFLHRRPKFVGALWGMGLSVLGVFLFTTVREGSTPRPGPPTVAPAEASAGAQQLDKERLSQLQEMIRTEPNNVAALLELAHMLLRVQMLEEAQTVNDRALKLDGNNLEALTHAAVLAASRGETAGSKAGLTAVLQKDPGFAEAWFFRGMLSMQEGDMATMQESLQQFVRLAPDGPQKERVRAMLGRSQATP